MARRAAAFGFVGLCLAMSACNGRNSVPGAASPSGNAVTIDVVAIKGAQSFSPNPATIPAGQMVVWHNIDNTTHRVVLDDRSVDTRNLSPGAFSAAMPLAAVGPYHCTIHPEMVGTLIH